MRCPACNAENPVDSKFCGGCGKVLLPAEEPDAGAYAAPEVKPASPAPAPPKRDEEIPAFEPPAPPKEKPEDDSDDPFTKIAKTRKGTAIQEKKAGQAEESPAPGVQSKGHALCEGCKGAFPAGSLSKVDGELLCELCISIKEKARKKPPLIADPFGAPRAFSEPVAAPGGSKPSSRLPQAAPSVKAPMSGAMMAVIVVAGVALLGLVGFALLMAFGS